MNGPYETKQRPTPYPTAWAVPCPVCGFEIDYEPIESEDGLVSFDPANWPVCESCDVMFEPKTMELIAKQQDSERKIR